MHLFYDTVIINNFYACLPFSYVTFHLQTCKDAESHLAFGSLSFRHSALIAEMCSRYVI